MIAHVSLLRSVVGAGAALLVIAAATPSYAAGPFASFEGNWTGTGAITTDAGAKERLRCRAHYNVSGGGNSMEQNLTCASDSYKFNVVSNVVASESGSISGEWQETSRGAKGHISGKITPTQISAYVQGLGFTASIGIAARSGRQSVTMSPTGTDIKNVSVTMSKS